MLPTSILSVGYFLVIYGLVWLFIFGCRELGTWAGNKSAKRKIDEPKDFITSEELHKQLSKPEPWWTKIYYPLYRYWSRVLHTPKRIKYFVQRGKRGWSDEDVWGLDDYLARVISQTIRELKKTHHGYPAGPFGHALSADEEDNENKAWGEKLDQIAKGFETMLDLEDYSFKLMEQGVPTQEVLMIEAKRKAEAKVSMMLLIKHFEDLWD